MTKKMTYYEQIKSPLWQRKRLEVLEANDFQCQTCLSVDEELHIHHPLYRRGAMIWEYKVSELQCLCHKCHKEVHAIDERLKQSMALLCGFHKLRLLGFADAMYGPDVNDESEDYLDGYDAQVASVMRGRI